MVMLYDGVGGATRVALAVTSGGVQVPGNGATLPTTGGLTRVAPGGAVTGIILQPGISNGQLVTVVNEAIAANTLTFAAAGTSNVSDGTGSVIAGVTGRSFIWDAAVSLWFPLK